MRRLKVEIQKIRGGYRIKILTEREIRGMPAGYENDLDESITFSKHIIEKSCCWPDSPRLKEIPKTLFVDQPLRKEEGIIWGHITKYEGMGVEKTWRDEARMAQRTRTTHREGAVPEDWTRDSRVKVKAGKANTEEERGLWKELYYREESTDK